MMNLGRYVIRSLVHYRRIHTPVALGVAIATTVLTGAFLVGDSVRYSLRQLAADSLQQIDLALISDRYFQPAIVEQLQANAEFQRHCDAAVGLSLLPQVTIETFGKESALRSSGVALFGIDDSFWALGDTVRPQRSPAADEIVLNATLATELQVAVGEQVILRLPSSDQVPADSPLGRKTDRVRSLSGLRVIEIIPALELGQFRLSPSQHGVRNAYVAVETLARAVEQPGRINAIVASSRSADSPDADRLAKQLRNWLHPSLEDRGISIRRVQQFFPRPAVVDSDSTNTPPPSDADLLFDHYQITTDRLVWDEEQASRIRTALSSEQTEEVLTYLVNSIESVRAASPTDAQRAIPYSMVSAVNTTAWGRLSAGIDRMPTMLQESQIILNRWAAEELQVTVGDKLRLKYFEPETTHGTAVETSVELEVAGIVPLTEPSRPYQSRRRAEFSKRPTQANDPDLTPTVEGVTDEDSIANWDPPFPYDASRIREQDDLYWQNHRTTPKAFVSLAAGQRLWGSRFGKVTSFRLPASSVANEEDLRARIQSALASAPNDAFRFLPVRQTALRAAAGTTPFEGLFLGFSMFLIASALMLVALLFRLGAESRAREAGLLRAVGWEARQVRRAWMRESIVVSCAGAILGLVGGIGYAALMLAGLRTWWLAAVVTPFIHLHLSPWALAVGGCSGVAMSLLVIFFSVRRLRQITPRQLLAGRMVEESVSTVPAGKRRTIVVVGLLVLLAVGLAVGAVRLQGEVQAGAFFGAGATLLAAGILTVIAWLRHAGHAARSVRALSLAGLAARAASRNPTRSALTVGLMATACFLIVAISAFRLAPMDAGTGGYNLVATSDRPLFISLQEGLQEEFANRTSAHPLADLLVLPMRVQEGDDASCRNLYRPTRPRVLGIGRDVIDNRQLSEMRFSWATTAATSVEDRDNPWRLLFAPRTADRDTIPVVIDKNTAMYSLQLYRGVGEEFQLELTEGQTFRFRVVGLLSNSILQGNLIVADTDLVRMFPTNQGSRFFLARTSTEQEEPVRQGLESRFGDEGLDVERSIVVLTDFLAVQNTYLSTFQSLGGLGMVLGTLGLAVVQARSVVERRGELALLKSVGFTQIRLGTMVLLENLSLLFTGLGIGLVAALVAVVPHRFVGGASIPWQSLLWMLAVIALIGLLAGLWAVRQAVRAEIVPALRGE